MNAPLIHVHHCGGCQEAGDAVGVLLFVVVIFIGLGVLTKICWESIRRK